MTKDLVSLLGQARDWGIRIFTASPREPVEMTLGVYRQVSDELVLVGRLSCEGDEYVFRYEGDYSGSPITAFPKLDKEYRSAVLWPFFAIRIPPLDREDVREEIANRSLDKDQVLKLLASVAKLSVANPYEFRLG